MKITKTIELTEQELIEHLHERYGKDAKVSFGMILDGSYRVKIIVDITND